MAIRLTILALAASSSVYAQSTGLQGPLLPSNHALVITVSQYRRSPLPGVLNDRKLANELAARFGVPPQNIVELSEGQVTRDGLKQALAGMDRTLMPGDRLYVYFSGHGARFFSKATGRCTESIVMQDMQVVTNAEFAGMLKPLAAKADKTVVMLDSCHSGGVAQLAGSRAFVDSGERPKFLPEASSPQCSLAVNDRGFSRIHGAELSTTDNNLVILAAARNDEVAWDTSKGGALTYNFEQCLDGAAADTDHSGSLSMQELTACVQARLDKTQAAAVRQHATLAGNSGLIPVFYAAPAPATAAPGNSLPGGAATSSAAPGAEAPGNSSTAGAAPAADVLAALNDIYNQRDDRWQVQTILAQPSVKIGSNLSLSIRSARDGFVYMFYQGTAPGSFYLLFPNQLDADNAIIANQDLKLPRRQWTVTALGPRGVDHVMVMVTATPRDFSALALPAEYVSAAGPFRKFSPTTQAAAQIGRIATLSAAAARSACRTTGEARDGQAARECSGVFGASLQGVEETD